MSELAEDAGMGLNLEKFAVPRKAQEKPGSSSAAKVLTEFEEGSPQADTEDFGLSSTLSEFGIDASRLDLLDCDLHEPIGILVELAKTGQIDPWDINIVELTDRFLNRIEELQKMDLRISSRTLLYSSVLLRMKASEIFQEEAEEEPDFYEEEEFSNPADFPVPKLPVRRKATRPVTLNELITELKKAESALSRKQERIRARPDENGKEEKERLSTGDVLKIAHEEAIVERVDLMETKLEEMFRAKDYVAFSELAEGSPDKVMDYIALLFLASNKKIWLYQRELFKELYVYPSAESAEKSLDSTSCASKPEPASPIPIESKGHAEGEPS